MEEEERDREKERLRRRREENGTMIPYMQSTGACRTSHKTTGYLEGRDYFWWRFSSGTSSHWLV